MATLFVHIPGSGVVAHELSGKESYSVGGTSENAVSIADPSVSPRHAEILRAGDGYRLKDLGSSNKCWLNGVAIAEAALHDGDTIRFGNIESVFVFQSAGKEAVETVLRGRLTLSIPGQGEMLYRFEGPLATVGWKSDNDLRIQDPSVSGHHAQFFMQGGKYRLKDLRSTNKTLLNGAPVDEVEINTGDRIQFGAVPGVIRVEYGLRRASATIRVSIPAPAAAAPAQQGDEWKAKYEALARENESLCVHNQQLSAQVKETAERVDKLQFALETTANEAQEKLAAWTQEREENEKKGGDLAKRIAESENALAAANKETAVLEGKLAALTAERTAELTRTAETERKLSGEVAEWKAKHETLAKDIEALRTETAKLTAEHKEAAARRDELQAALEAREKTAAQTRGEAQQEAERLSGELAQARSRQETLSRELEAAAKKEEDFNKRLAESAGALAAVQKALDTVQAAASETQEKLAAATKECDALKASAAAAEGKLAALTQERDTLKAAVAELEGKLQALTRERDGLKGSASEAEGKLAALGKERDALQTASGDVQGKLAALTQERDTLKAAVADLEGKLATLSRERAAAPAPVPVAVAPVPMPVPVAVAPTSVPAAAPAPTGLSLKIERPAAPAPVPAPIPVPVPAAAPAAPAVPRPLSLLREAPLPSADPVETPKTGLIEINTPGSAMARFANRLPQGEACDADSPTIQKIVETAPEVLNGMRRCLHSFIKNQSETSLLQQLLSELHNLTEQTVQANLSSVATFSFALERLIDDLMKIPGQINPSSLRTVSQSIDFLVTLLDGKNIFRTKQPDQARIYAVDDDPEACRTIRGAIEMVNLKVDCGGDAKTTLAALEEQQFDLVLIDVGLPEMNGFELCTHLRKLPAYKKVPVVFITGAVTVQNRVQSSLSGGNDFIAKPFNLLELGVKTLIWIFRGQLGMA